MTRSLTPPDGDGGTASERLTFGVGGSALSARVTGPEDGELVVLLHGLLAGSRMWQPVADELAATGRRVVAFDLPGHGETLTPARADHSPGGLAEMVGTWLRVTPGGPVWLVGHDLGGGIAQVIATRYPTAVSHLTLSASMVEDRWPLPFVPRLQRRAESPLPLRAVPVSRLRSWVDAGVAADRLPDDVFAPVFADKLADEDIRRSLARLLAQLSPVDVVAAAAQLSRLPMPVDLVWGDRDPYTPSHEFAQRLLELTVDAEMGLVEEAGHWAPLERPREFAAIALRLRGRDRGGGAAAAAG